MDTMKSRAATSREAEEGYVYERPDWLKLPESVTTRFAGEGKVLKWVRVTSDGKDDFKNIGLKLQEGWSFVTPDQVPEMAEGFQTFTHERHGNLVLRGDVALACIPKFKADAKKAYFAGQTRDMEAAIDKQLAASSDGKMPIFNQSVSKSSSGRAARFDD